jgi:hypothetical protein
MNSDQSFSPTRSISGSNTDKLMCSSLLYIIPGLFFSKDVTRVNNATDMRITALCIFYECYHCCL